MYPAHSPQSGIRLLVVASIGALFILGMVMAATLRLDTPVAHAASITVDSTADEVVDDGNCTLREAIAAASTDTTVDGCTAGDPGADTITFAGSLSGTITLSSTLEITSSMTIQGPGEESLAISGDNAVRVFDIEGETTSIDVALAGLTIRDGNIADDDGGGVWADTATLSVVDSTIINNTAYAGGGIAGINSTLLLTGTDIVSNTANPLGGLLGGVGGGIAIQESELSTVDTNVVSNTADWGGGIYLNTALLTMQDSTTNVNEAEVGGGIAGLNSTLLLAGADIISNTAALTTTGAGGGIAGVNSTLLLAGTDIISNSAKAGVGGGIATNGSNLSIIDTDVISNTAGGGGAIYTEQSVLNVSESTFHANEAEIEGGAIEVVMAPTQINLASTSSQGLALTSLKSRELAPSAGRTRGAVQFIAPEADIADSTFTSNTASSGGAIATEVTTTIRSSLVRGNSATGTEAQDGGGGGIVTFVSAVGPVTIIDSELRQNSTGYAGGGLNITVPTQVLSSTITDNNAAVAGGGISSLGALALQNTTVSTNTTFGAGGGVYNGGYLEMINSTLSSNQSSGTIPGASGGGGLAQATFGITPSSVISYSTIVSNTAAITPTSGIGVLDGPMTLEASIVANNDGTNNFGVLGGSITSAGYNLTNSTISPLDQTSDITGTAALLGPLADNGGPTLTHLPLNGSPAIDAIPANECGVTTDQRGADRPLNEGCDIGAVELGELIFEIWLPFIVK